MDDLFSEAPKHPENPGKSVPLAERLRPRDLNEFFGQEAILSADAPLGRMCASGRLQSIILWGPPGCGKTTLARLLARHTGGLLIPLSAVMSGLNELRKAFEQAKKAVVGGRVPILFIDEIHRYHKGQQDGLLKAVEEGLVTLIGATTENPSFALNSALISRCQVIVLDRLNDQALLSILAKAETYLKKSLPIDEVGRQQLIRFADGDGRFLLNLVASLSDLDQSAPLSPEELEQALNRRLPIYDRQYEAHYNLISALHKSIRGSDPDAALYWFCRMIDGGEDPRYIGRRMVRMASEDVGLADPMAVSKVNAALEAYERLGSPEGELMLAQVVIGLAMAPKSNAVYMAYKSAMKQARQSGSLLPPKHILNAPTRLMKELGYGDGYRYDHDQEDRFSGQNYFPDGMERPVFYEPANEGFEEKLRQKLEYLQHLRNER